jgi:hypothetical protein
MEMDPIGQYRPAPEFAQEAITLAPADLPEEPGYLDELALRLDQMKIDAAIETERLRPGLNGFFAFMLITGVAYLALYVAQYQAGTLAALEHGVDYLSVPRGAGALGIGVAAAIVTGVWCTVLIRRMRQAIQEYERDLVARGGTPLPERGQSLHPRKARGHG